MNGKVYLVGAGPGDAELITVKAERLLRVADAVVYDALINPGLLALAKPGAELIDAGKRSRQHTMRQEAISSLLVELAQAGKTVVRLKGGDPFVFGRGGEELEALMKAGIPSQVVPGVTSAIAAPAYAGIALTHRNYSSSMHIYTAHAKEGSTLSFDYEAMARLHGTHVFLMGSERIGEICGGFVCAGMDESTPAGTVERGTTAHQRLTLGTLTSLPDLASERGVSAPAIIVIGPAASLANELDWRADLPLNGVSVAVTRPKTGSRLATLLRDNGADVTELPSILTRPIEAEIPPLAPYDVLAFSSPTGVEYFFERMALLNRDIREFKGNVAALGPATAKVLRERGLCVAIMPGTYEGSALNALLSGRVLVVRPKEDSGKIQGDPCILYETLPAEIGIPDDIDVFAFSSASAVRAIATAPGFAVGASAALCIGESTASAAREAKFERVIVAQEATIDSMVDELIRRYC